MIIITDDVDDDDGDVQFNISRENRCIGKQTQNLFYSQFTLFVAFRFHCMFITYKFTCWHIDVVLETTASDLTTCYCHYFFELGERDEKTTYANFWRHWNLNHLILDRIRS
jgi:hypothetical protein